MPLPSVNPIIAAASPEQGDGNPFNYVPTGWICILFIILFSLTTMAHILQAVWLKVWYMLPTLALCGLVEILGWTGRYWGHENPYNRNPFLMQICTTIMAPSFMTAAMFLILPRIVSELGQEYSRMSPRLSAVTLFDLLSIEFIVRYAFGRPAYETCIDREKRQKVPKRVALMLVGLGVASVFILIRSIYRTIELTDGWNGRIISTEKWFNWFDGGAIVMAMVTFNVFHPGWLIKDYGNKLLRFGETPTNRSREQKLPDEV
ncbi:unnamed protein product [Rhizoctonia solani]|uniref:Uncharacterized protein n=1 Tax=Rhizoctonia solani TaxID=456999 RepID=A0A8H3C2I9_9AGAM|nr:unnamed protein product [Rhizoctonia solani]